MVTKALEIAEAYSSEKGCEIEVIDPRTLYPLDETIILESVKKTNKLMVLDEGGKSGNFANEIMALVNEKAFDHLDERMIAVTSADTPIPFSPTLEQAYLPSEQNIRDAIDYLIY